MHREQDLFRCPDYYPLRIDFDKRNIHFLRMSRETYRDSVFLDTRVQHLGAAQTVRLDDAIFAASRLGIEPLPVTYILHPAFCCSTLLSRYFELLPSSLVLREPLLLTQVALVPEKNTPLWADLFDCSVRLLTRGYKETRRIVIKTHEPCNVLGRQFLQQNDRAFVVFLMTPLRFFVLSVLKANERRIWIRSRVSSVLASAEVGPAWQDVRPSALTDAQAAAFMWTINHNLRQELVHQPEGSRVLLLDSERLLEDPFASLSEIARFSQNALDDGKIAEMVGHPSMRRYSKNVSRFYDATSRRLEIAQLEESFGTEADAGVEWVTRRSAKTGATA
jgi:hypothetical protein